eukprot:SAG11_NODE_4901_length_1729_cov_2.046012_2_plen_48_part_01
MNRTSRSTGRVLLIFIGNSFYDKFIHTEEVSVTEGSRNSCCLAVTFVI